MADKICGACGQTIPAPPSERVPEVTGGDLALCALLGIAAQGGVEARASMERIYALVEWALIVHHDPAAEEILARNLKQTHLPLSVHDRRPSAR